MNIKKMYFGLVSLVSIIVIAVSFGIILTSLGKSFFISNDEYLQAHSWEINSCNYDLQQKYCRANPDYSDCAKNLVNEEKYKQELENCKKNKKEEIILKRTYNLKLDLISSISTLFVFLILFIIHYRIFRKIES